jgi:V8-like Glu-specific endopeptidase
MSNRVATGLAVLAAVLAGGLSAREASAITGGFPVAQSGYWMNYLANVNRGVVALAGGGCTGLLVAPRLVLTAAHCGRNGNSDTSKPAGGMAGFGPDTPFNEAINAPAEIDHYDVYGGGTPPDKIDVGLWVLDRPASTALPYWKLGSTVELEDVTFFGYGGDGQLEVADCTVAENYVNGNTSRYSLACGGQGSEGGDSGGPVFDATLGLAGVNRGGGGGDPRDAYGTRLTPDVVAWVNGYIAEYATVLRMGDFDGDGRADLFHWSPNGHRSFQDQANGTPGDPSWLFHDGQADDVLVWCSQQLLIGRFNYGGREDLLCYNGPGDKLYVNYAGPGGDFPDVGAVNKPHTWCDGEVYAGDFNADGWDDLFCRQPGAGRKVILNTQDSADPFPNASTWLESSSWCGQQILIGAFDGHGDDVLCWNPGDGFYYRRGQGDGSLAPHTYWASNWCTGGEILVGDLDADGLDDLLCWYKTAGSIVIDLSIGVSRTGAPPFGSTDHDGWYSFCEAAAYQPKVTGRLADVTGDGRADFVCHDQRTGQVWFDLNGYGAEFFNAATEVKVPNVDTPVWP